MTGVTPGWIQMMARYNIWQNGSMMKVAETLPPAELERDRGAFFGSILGTFSHIFWADGLLMSRLQGGDGPGCSIEDSPRMFRDWGSFREGRSKMDGRIQAWADGLDDSFDTSGDLSWYSGLAKRQMTMPFAKVATHLFNHQTHHRGQIHAMLTAAGGITDSTDLTFMP